MIEYFVGEIVVAASEVGRSLVVTRVASPPSAENNIERNLFVNEPYRLSKLEKGTTILQALKWFWKTWKFFVFRLRTVTAGTIRAELHVANSSIIIRLHSISPISFRQTAFRQCTNYTRPTTNLVLAYVPLTTTVDWLDWTTLHWRNAAWRNAAWRNDKTP